MPPTHTRAARAGSRPRLWLLARVHTVPGVQLMSCHACGWFIKGNTVPRTAQEPARDAREQLLGAVLCVFSLEFTRQAERIVRRCSRRTLEHPKCGASTAAIPHSAFDDMIRLEAAVGCSSRAGRCHRPADPKLSEVGTASWLASQSALPAAHIIYARTWGETTRSQYTVPRRTAPPLDGPSGRCASRQRPAEMSGRESPVLTRGVCLLTQASLGPDLV